MPFDDLPSNRRRGGVTDLKEIKMRDDHGRKIDYMRVSITDRCNLRCRYCMPEGIQQVEMKEILTYEEIITVCKAAAKTGIRKIKVTGGEPLVRLGCPELIGEIKQIPGIRQVTLTTNGVLLSRYLPELLKNGLDAVNISLDTLDESVYQKITGRDELPQVLTGIHRAMEGGLKVKINAVLQKGVNEQEWPELVALTKRYPLDVRFIEMMPIGYGKKYETVYNEDILRKLALREPKLRSDNQNHGNGPAVYYQIPGALGSVGFISAIHGKFCKNCNRIRLTSMGRLKPCLCFGDSVDVRKILRETEEEKKEEQVCLAIFQTIRMKPEGHRFEAPEDITEQRQMVQIGG